MEEFRRWRRGRERIERAEIRVVREPTDEFVGGERDRVRDESDRDAYGDITVGVRGWFASGVWRRDVGGYDVDAAALEFRAKREGVEESLELDFLVHAEEK